MFHMERRSSRNTLIMIKYFGMPISVTRPIYRNINNEESSLGIGLKRMYISSVCSDDFHMNKIRREEFPS